MAWQELADTAVDLGVPAFDTVTVRELSVGIGARTGVNDTPEVRDALDRLLVATERARYARSPAPEAAGAARLLPDLDAVVRALQSGSSAPERLRALLAPHSLSSPILRRMGLAREAPDASASPGNDRTPAGA